MTRELTKWPRLLVVGEPVTEEQANDILLRTNSWWGHTNDREWQATICGLAGIPMNEFDSPRPEAFEDEIAVLNLHYLHNARIASSWIGGPHGWCNWDGTIGCSNYNIGKWPSVEEVTGDWAKIAEAWPFLNLRAQLVPEEGEADVVAAEWLVREGRAEEVEPGDMLTEPSGDMLSNLIALHMPHGERGVSFDRLRAAVQQVRARAAELRSEASQ